MKNNTRHPELDSGSNIPKLRFPEFLDDGEWEEKKLGDIANKINSGKTPLGGESVYTEKGVLFIRSQNVFDNKLSLENSTFIPEEVNDSMKNSIVAPNDILLNITGASLGRSCVVPKDFKIGNVNQHVCIVRLNQDSNPHFIQPIFSSERGQNLFTNLQTGSGREGLTFQSIKEIKISLPSIQEQQKIADCLSSVDNLITAQSKKVETLKEHKKALMQQLFPQDGEEVPKLRFSEFLNDGEWEEKILDDVVNRYDNLRVPVSAINRIAGKTPYYGANGIQGYVSGYTHDGEFILIAEDGANNLKDYPIQYVNGKIWVNNHAHVLQAKKNIAYNRFLKFAISKINIEPFLVGGGRAKLNANIMMKLKIKIPKPKEQQKIANFLSSIDELITSSTKKVETLKEHKKALMQQLFPSAKG